MSAQLKANESDLPQPILSEVQPHHNGSKDNNTMAGTRREPPALRQDNLTDAMAVLVSCMAEDREERREQRAVTQALIAKLSNGSGNKLQAWASPMIAAGVLVFAGIAWVPKQETRVESLNSEVATLRREIAEEREERKLKQTYDEKMRGNLRELGIIIDPVTAEVTVVVPRKVRR